MKNKINIAELLKDCPSGMELYCTMWDNLYFDRVENDLIHCYYELDGYRNTTMFCKDGCYTAHKLSKCVIFPKGKTTWEGFHRPFKDGDIVVDTLGGIHIMQNPTTSYCYFDRLGILDKTKTTCVRVERLATEVEKKKLFDAIKANGYKWNSDTKSLEKLIDPKFKVGDTIINKTDKWLANRTIKSYVEGIGYFTTINDWVRINEQDNWELVKEPKFKIGDEIKKKDGIDYRLRTIVSIDNNYYIIKTPDWFDNCYITDKLPFNYQDEYELIHSNKFDITTLKPFDKVLCRHNKDNKWKATLFSHLDEDFHSHCYKFVTSNGSYPYMIPYEGNEHLRGTTEDCDDFYKTWEK